MSFERKALYSYVKDAAMVPFSEKLLQSVPHDGNMSFCAVNSIAGGLFQRPPL